MITTPKGLRLHIALFGRRNVGKSSLLNALTRQEVSIVSPVAGTTTDPVEKPMELLPLGPVVFIDTAGVDDQGMLGALRVEKTRQVFDRTDLGVVIAAAGEWGRYEQNLLAELQARNIPAVVVFNKTDEAAPSAEVLAQFVELPVVLTSAAAGMGITELREALLRAAPAAFIDNPALAGDLVGPGETAILVVPIDKEAPKGRLILPQVQTIRDLLDGDSLCCVVKERELRQMLENLKTRPRLVVTDSQAFLKVAADTPREVPLTSFSILMSRFKGDLVAQVQGTLAIDSLRAGDRVLVAEACSHHPIGEDIGRVKIPRWLTQYVGGKLEFDHVQGRDFPEDLSSYKLVIHCGACTWNRRAMLSRILKCRQAGVPITNYGLTIAYSLGIFERALEPFPAALQAYRSSRKVSPKPITVPAHLPGRTLDRNMDDATVLGWLREEREEELKRLWAAADRTRREHVGDDVHLRGLIEISNHCVRECAYCGLRRNHRALQRYRMSADEILAAAHQAMQFGYGTVVLQAGEDAGIRLKWMEAIVRRIKLETPLAVTLSLGERTDDELAVWRAAGADRYLLRFETSDPALFQAIHPSLPGRRSDRIEILRQLRRLGYEAGSGVMVGIPGQTYTTLLRDLRTFQSLDLDMIGIGPYLPHPATPLAATFDLQAPSAEQTPNSEALVYRMVALTRLLCPQANIPSTSALATINKYNGRELGLMRGANVVMPNVTPLVYRRLYQIYPAKACIDEDSKACNRCLGARITSLGRVVGRGSGGRLRHQAASPVRESVR